MRSGLAAPRSAWRAHYSEWVNDASQPEPRAARTIEQTGERGGGAAQAAVVFGWFGIVEVSIVLVFVVIIVLSAANS